MRSPLVIMGAMLALLGGVVAVAADLIKDLDEQLGLAPATPAMKRAAPARASGRLFSLTFVLWRLLRL